MNLIDLKNNLIDLNLELEQYLSSKEQVVYNKPTAFIFSEETGEWNRSESGLGEILVHPLFQKQICPNITYTMLVLNEVFKNQSYDSELNNLYQLFRNNLYLLSKKLKELDDEEELKGHCFLTYEQIINEIKFSYFHLYCLGLDSGNFNLSDKLKGEYSKSHERMEFFRSISINLELMLLEANEVAEEKITYSLLELIQEGDSSNYKLLLENDYLAI